MEIHEPGAVAAYACLCTDTAPTLAELLRECPGHGRPLTGEYPNPTPGGVLAGHECFVERPCPPAQADRLRAQLGGTPELPPEEVDETSSEERAHA